VADEFDERASKLFDGLTAKRIRRQRAVADGYRAEHIRALEWALDTCPMKGTVDYRRALLARIAELKGVR
jgi:hypothetical protein